MLILLLDEHGSVISSHLTVSFFECSVPSMIVPSVKYGLKLNDTNQVKSFVSLVFGNTTAFHVYRQTMMRGTFLQNYKPDLRLQT
jgi:hypothetical protein